MRGYSDASGLTFTKAMELAQAAEAADKNAQDLAVVEASTCLINGVFVTRSVSTAARKGISLEPAEQNKKSLNRQPPQQRSQTQTTYHVEESDEGLEFEYTILHIPGKHQSPFIVRMLLNMPS